jgi:hypothetical protein
MAAIACLWCEKSLKPGVKVCPECGLQNPAPDLKAASARVARRGWRVVLALVAVPLMLSATYAAGISHRFPLVSEQAAIPAAAPVVDPLLPPAAYTDPLQRSVWINGVKAVQQALAQPSYANFTTSFVHVAAGNVVSFCGEVPNTSGYGSQRFVSVFGQTQATMLEANDPSFEVLWTRVCGQVESAA